MVCKYCGSQLSISDKTCPFCGQENTAAAEHQQAMSGYEERFHSTRQEVLGEVRKSRGTLALMSVIVLLALLNVFVLIAKSNSYSIESFLHNREYKKNYREYEKAIQNYLESGDFVRLYGYSRGNGIGYSGDKTEYLVTYEIAGIYYNVFDVITQLRGDESSFRTTGENISALSAQLVELYKYDRQEYHSYNKEEYYKENTLQAIARAKEQCNLVLKDFFGLTEEELEKLETLDKQQLEYMLGRRIGLYEE